MTALEQQGALAKEASRTLATAGTAKKNAALEAIETMMIINLYQNQALTLLYTSEQ